MTDKQLLSKLKQLGIRETIEEILVELEKSEKDMPEWPEDAIAASSIVVESAVHLLCAAFRYQHDDHQPFDEMEPEAINTIAMAMRWIENAPNY